MDGFTVLDTRHIKVALADDDSLTHAVLGYFLHIGRIVRCGPNHIEG